MKNRIIDKCDLLSSNSQVLKKNFKWDSEYMAYATAVMFTAANREVDVATLKECESILKHKAGVFSDFRGIAKLPILCKMAMSSDPEAYLNRVMEIHSYIEQGKFTGNNYRIVAASIIAKVTRDHMMIELAKKYPEYGFEVHKGYGTAKHMEALKKFGPIKGVHRFTYKPVLKVSLQEMDIFNL